MRLSSVLRTCAIPLGLNGLCLLAVIWSCGGGAKGAKHAPGDDKGDLDPDPPTPESRASGKCDLGAWTGKDHVKPSQDPPCGLKPAQVPMFVAIGFDDNPEADGMQWALDVAAKRKINFSFMQTSSYGSDDAVRATWKAAAKAGHEIGDHTVSHLPNHGGTTMDAKAWMPEIAGCGEYLMSHSLVEEAHLLGFRAPYLEYSNGTFAALKELEFHYDVSIEEGYEDGQDGTNFYWPYTLDDLSPGHTVQVSWGDGLKEITPHRGLWELPVYAVIVPQNLRAKMHSVQDWFDIDGGQITGVDYNLWVGKADDGFGMTKDEVVATLKNTFDLHYKGNRAPFFFGGHTPLYTDGYDPPPPNATVPERRAAIEEFLDYVLTKPDVRVVSYSEVLDWLRHPTSL